MNVTNVGPVHKCHLTTNETRRCEWCGDIAQGQCGCPAEAEIERLREFLMIWIADGSLQTFEHREKFRSEAKTILWPDVRV